MEKQGEWHRTIRLRFDFGSGWPKVVFDKKDRTNPVLTGIETGCN